jgi:hypothetical protein
MVGPKHFDVFEYRNNGMVVPKKIGKEVSGFCGNVSDSKE